MERSHFCHREKRVGEAGVDARAARYWGAFGEWAVKTTALKNAAHCESSCLSIRDAVCVLRPRDVWATTLKNKLI
jgi:hypothetical protein